MQDNQLELRGHKGHFAERGGWITVTLKGSQFVEPAVELRGHPARLMAEIVFEQMVDRHEQQIASRAGG